MSEPNVSGKSEPLSAGGRVVSIYAICKKCERETLHETALVVTTDENGRVMVRGYRCSWCRTETLRKPPANFSKGEKKQAAKTRKRFKEVQ
jgi:hypothetical protein